MEGWLKIHRAMLDWEWYKDTNTKVLFLHFLLKANYADSTYKGHVVPRGSLVTGFDSLVEQLKISRQQLRTAMKKLQSTNEVTLKTTNKFSIVCLVNYESYQGEQHTNNTQVTLNQHSSNTQVTASKEVKKKEVKKKRIKYNDAFEIFWKNTNYPKRKNEDKGVCETEFLDCMKFEGITEENILKASNIYAEENKGNGYAFGLKRFLTAKTILQYLQGDLPKGQDSNGYAPNSKVQKAMELKKHNNDAFDKLLNNCNDEKDVEITIN